MPPSENHCISELNIDTYAKIVNIIYSEHNSHLDKWMNEQDKFINLKSTLVCDVCSDHANISFLTDEFKAYLDLYLKTLSDLQYNIISRVLMECSVSFASSRIKDESSILLKMFKKNNENMGKFPIVKCLNDLLGFRLIDPNYSENIESLIKNLDDVKNKDYRIKHLDRVNGEYKGYHIYFLGIDNKCFPVELQVWDKKNENLNFQSHERYKKEYTLWPGKYKNLIEGSE